MMATKRAQPLQAGMRSAKQTRTETAAQFIDQLSAKHAESNKKEPEEETMCADPEPWQSNGVMEVSMYTMSATTEMAFWPSRDTQSTCSVFIYSGDEGIRSVYLTLVDAKEQSSDRIWVKTPIFSKPTLMEIDIAVKETFGDIVQVKLEESSSEWYCSHIEVKTPSGKCSMFPCYRWIGKNEVIIREGSARLPQDDTELFKKQREKDLKSRRTIFRWIQKRPGFPQSMDGELPLDVKFDKVKESDFDGNFRKVLEQAVLDKLLGCFQSWKDIPDFEKIFREIYIKDAALVNMIQDWNTDYMFGYQFLNGCNPVMIQKCVELPEKFPVTHEMVKGSLQRGLTLQEEIEKGNIYIVDYEILEGLPANKTKYTQYYLTAPICLLYNNRLNQIVPIAIQLSQTPGKTSPIFLPDENEYDWMLAKMWVKSSDFNLHQLVTHLLKTHLISEVFEVAMYRQLSTVHPVFKLLIPHVHFTIAINAEAREKLISDDGVFSKISSISGNGIDQLLGRAMETLTLKSLCFPETIKARGMEDAPKYYYRDDGIKIWEAINCFVSDVIEIYYDSDEKVQKDVEIQGFVNDVSACGMLDSKGEKFPQSLNTRAELTEYLTAVIFNASAQHAAVNFGQFDWYAWIPNSPSTMRKPPPEKKDETDLKYIMETLPNRDISSEVLGTVWALSRFQENERYLGMYPDMRFTEPAVKEAIKKFRKKLDEVTDIIMRRNEELTMDYCYLSPNKIPNSVAI